MLYYEPTVGEEFSVILENTLVLASKENEEVQTTFIGMTFTVNPGDTMELIKESFSVRSILRHLESPEYQAQERDAENFKDRMTDVAKLLHKKEFKRALFRAPKKMALSDEPLWRKIVATKADGYGGRLIRFVERFARLTEGCVVRGETVEECADKMFHLANIEDLPVCIYSEAVFMLSKVRWIHSEQLDRWYNPPIQVKNERKKVNKSPGLLRLLSLR